MNRFLLCLCFLCGLILEKPIQAFPEKVRQYGHSAISLSGEIQPEHRVDWPLRYDKIDVSAIIGWEMSRQSDPRIVTSERYISGIKVRLSAFNSSGKPLGQINGPGVKDDVFFSGTSCKFTPPSPGTYTLKLEVLDDNGRPVTLRSQDKRGKFSKNRKLATTTTLIVAPVSRLYWIQASNWVADERDPNLFSRKMQIFPTESNRESTGGSSLQKELKNVVNLRLDVVPPFPVKNIQQISWLSVSNPVKYSRHVPMEFTQFFRYDPARDTPRNADLFVVKATVVP